MKNCNKIPWIGQQSPEKGSKRLAIALRGREASGTQVPGMGRPGLVHRRALPNHLPPGVARSSRATRMGASAAFSHVHPWRSLASSSSKELL